MAIYQLNEKRKIHDQQEENPIILTSEYKDLLEDFKTIHEEGERKSLKRL